MQYNSNNGGEEEEELYLEEEERYTPLSTRWVDHTPTDNNRINVEEDDSYIPDLADLERATQYHVVDRNYLKRERFKRHAIFVCCAIGVVGVIWIAVSLVGSIPNRASSLATNNNNDNAPSSYYKVPPPPSGIDAICDISNVETVEGYATCKRICDDASCCLNKLQSCRSSNVQVCDMYTICLLLTAYTGTELDIEHNIGAAEVETNVELLYEGGYFLPDAPTTIDSICSQENRATRDGNVQCDEVCRNAACCESSCSSSSKCENYQICFNVDILDNLNTTTTPTSLADSTSDNANNDDTELGIVQLCSDINNQGCIEECKERECCFRTTGYNCNNEFTKWCGDYSICANLSMWQSSQQSQEATSTTTSSEFKHKCHLHLSDMKECEQLCDERSCCFTVDNCTGFDSKTYCHESFECINLPNFEEVYNNAHGLKPVFPLDDFYHNSTSVAIETTATTTTSMNIVNEVCSLNAIAVNGTQDCKDICKQRACCFTTTSSSSSSSSNNCANNVELKEWCEEYNVCKILEQQNINNDNITPSLSTTTPTITTDNSTTTTLVDAVSNTVIDVIDAVNTTSPVAASAADAVNTACSPSIFETIGKSSCQQLCDVRACCFIKGPFNCFDEQHDWCLEYSACNVLVTSDNKEQQQAAATTTTPTTNSTAMDEVNAACSHNVLIDSKTKCQDLCDDRACCFASGPFNCNDELHVWCLEYSACNALSSLNTTPQQEHATAQEVEAKCEASKLQDPSIASQCAKLCSTRSCCFSDIGNDNCYKFNSDWCDEFRSCGNLPNYNGYINAPSGSSTSPTPEQPVQDASNNDPPSLPEESLTGEQGNHIVGHLGKFGVLAYDSSSQSTKGSGT